MDRERQIRICRFADIIRNQCEKEGVHVSSIGRNHQEKEVDIEEVCHRVYEFTLNECLQYKKQ